MAGTTLHKGDVAVVQAAWTGNNIPSTPTNGPIFEFVLLTSVSAGTSVNFVDANLKSDGTAAPNSYGTMTWTTQQNLSAGAVITIDSTSYDTNGNAVFGASTGSVSGSLSLSPNGFRVTAYQGTFGPSTLLYTTAINGTVSEANPSSTPDYPYASNSFWNVNYTTGGDTSASQNPSTLAGYEVALNGAPQSSGLPYQGAYYSGSTSGTAAQIIANINTPSNWTPQVTYSASIGIVPAFTVSAPAPPAPTITGLTAASDSGTRGDNRTDLSALTISGTTTASGDTVNLYLDGSSTAVTAVTNAASIWTYTFSGLSTTTHTLNATVTRNNVTGAVSTPYNFVVDPVPSAPSVTGLTAATDSGVSSTDGITKNTAIGAQGTGTSGDTVNVYVDNATSTSVGNAIVNNGVWSIASLTGTLSPGSHTLKATQTDPYGNVSVLSGNYAVTIDTTAPAVPSTPILDSASDSGSSHSDRITNDTTPTVTGTAESGTTVTLYDTDGTTQLGSAVATGGNYSITSSVLTDATHALTVKATDTAGNTSSASSGLSVNIDTTAPTLASASVNGNQLFLTYTETGSGLESTDLPVASEFTVSAGNNTPAVTNVAYDAAQNTVTLTLASAVRFNAGVTLSYAPNGTLSQEIQDVAGNLAAGFSNQSVMNNTPLPPRITGDALTTPPNPQGVNAGTTFTFSVTFDQVVTVDTGGSNSNLSLALNNNRAASYSRTSPDGRALFFSYTVGANDDVADLQATGFNTLQNGASIKGSSSVDADLSSNFTPIDTGTPVDTQAPAQPGTPVLSVVSDSGVPGDGITNAKRPVITGTAEPGASVTLYDTDGATVLGTGTATNGSYSITPNADLSDATHALTIKATDAAGNVSVASQALSVTIDTQAPSVSSIAPVSGAATTNNAASEVYTVTFAEPVTGVDAGDFRLTSTNTASGTLAAPSVVAVAPSNGYATTYTVTATGVTGDGTLRLDLNASNTGITDVAGNAFTAGFTTGQVYTIDHTAPAQPGVPTLLAASDSGPINSDHITNVTTPTVTGSAEIGATVALYDGAGTTPIGTGVATNGTYSITPTAALAAGAHPLTVTATDAAGNTSAASSPLGVTIDTTAPALSSSSINGNTLTLTYTETGSGLYAGPNIAKPAVGDYAVTVGNQVDAVTAVAVDATAKTVTLTLTSAVATSDVVGLAYTAGADPGALRDIAGNPAANLSLPSVTNVTPLPPPSGGGGGGGGSANTATDGPDRLAGTLGDDTLAGLGGNDTISGDDGNDLLYGNQGNDSIVAGSGNNTVYGGVGDDVISAGSGNDLLFGNEGADTINAGDGNNTLVGGQDSTDGADLITSGSGNDLIFGNGGDDSVAAGAGNDIVVGGFGNDILFGNQGNDLIYGNQGNDVIYGGQGDDTLIGGQGDDTLTGGEGNDVIYGNEGADRIVFGINSGNDRVMDFSPSDGDRLDLQGQTYTTTTDVNGNAVLTLSGGGAITLAGIAASQVGAGIFA